MHHNLWTIFDTAIEQIISLESQINNDKTLPRIQNVVGTTNLLEKGENLMLETIVTYLGAMAKFQPRRFAAIVLRIKDPVATTTCLVFRSGKLVVVGSVSWMHALFACHMYRLVIESVQVTYRYQERIMLTDLVGRTLFHNWGIWNIVASVHLGCRPNLKILTELLTDATSWNPELFPGLTLLIWLKPKNQCKCKKKKKNKSCACNAQALIFDTGNVVITGCRNMSDISLAHHRIKMLLEDDSLLDHNEQLPRSERFAARRQMLLDIEFEGFRKSKKRQKPENHTQQWNEDLQMITRKCRVKKWKPMDLKLHPFVNACLLGQVENVEFMLQYDTSQVANAWQEMNKLQPEERNEQIMNLLRVFV